MNLLKKKDAPLVGVLTLKVHCAVNLISADSDGNTFAIIIAHLSLIIEDDFRADDVDA